VSKPTTAQKPVAQTGFCTDDKVCTIRPVSKPPPRASTEAPITVAARSVPTVNIRPGVSILAVLAHLEYKVWHALAEYVDNALQSFHAAAAKIRESDGPDARLKVEIEIESGHITITDNAGGIGIDAFPRAFRPAEIPTDCMNTLDSRGCQLCAGYIARDPNEDDSVGVYVSMVLNPNSECAPDENCWVNCDGSTDAPIVNIADFVCFMERFAAGETWANCDGSTTSPVLNVLDFNCFINRYSAGCE
jgi:hypothetical protein